MPATALLLTILAAAAAISLALLPIVPALVSIVLATAMLGIAWVDFREFRIPDVLSLPAIPVGLLATGRLIEADMPLIPLDGVAGMLAGSLVFYGVREAYYRLRGREGLGLGDVKLAGVAGAWTGWQGLPDVVLLAAILALALIAATHLIAKARTAERRELTLSHRVPFGVTLAPSIWIVWLLQRLQVALL